MNELQASEHGKQRSQTRHGRTRAGVLALTLGLTATVVASPPKKAESIDLAGSAVKLTHWFQIGRASWYGKKFQGRKTATGESFDMNAFTCAHRTLPLGSWIRVTNLSNRKSMLVRVNDRGPVPETRILDLSYAAARKLGVGGVSKVRIEPVNASDPDLMSALTQQALLKAPLPIVR